MTGRLVLIGLTILLALSQYQLWFGTGSISELQRLTDELEEQETENQRLSSRNDELVSEVNALKTDPEAIEELLKIAKYDSADFLSKQYKSMEEEGNQDPEKLAVHCMAGVGRTGTLMAIINSIMSIDR